MKPSIRALPVSALLLAILIQGVSLQAPLGADESPGADQGPGGPAPASGGSAPAGGGAGLEGAEVSDRYYQVSSDWGSADAAAITKELELRFAVYNRLFRFNPSMLKAPLRVRAFQDKRAYDAYLSARIGESKPGAVYLHYSQPERRELVIHRGSPEEGRMLPHQTFIQFIRAFIPYPPLWIWEGFAIYFSTLKYDSLTEELYYQENLSWLEYVKGLGDDLPSLESIFLADTQDIPANFQPMAWSLVSFFLNNGGSEYFRTLTELFMVMSANASAQANAEAVMRYIRLWSDLDTFNRDHRSYVASRKTFTELVREGQDAYTAQNPAGAELSFMSALDLRPTHYAPYYYLGLLAYEEKNYTAAKEYYQKALQYGADNALVQYALGLNAASAGRKAEAVDFLKQAAAASPDRYKDRVETLLERLQ